MELEIYNAFVKAGVSEQDAKAAVESINKAIDHRYTLHSNQLATKTDMAEMEARLLRALAEMQRWTLTTMFAALGALAVFLKFFN
jgi:hypothetical protein